MPKQSLLRRRPAETKTAGLGSAGAAAIAALAPPDARWTALVVALVAWLPAAFTWLETQGGARGVLRKLWSGSGQ